MTATEPIAANGLALASRYRLNDGHAIPALGLGMWNLGSGNAAEAAVRDALDAGYRLFDTAKLYGNERELGAAVRASGVRRDQVFVTTKLWNDDHGYEPALRAFDGSRAALGLDYVDLYLIHWPRGRERSQSWRALEEIRKRGGARSIGVSNYTIRHLEELLAESEVVPAVNQVEFHPFLFQRELLEFCTRHGILVEAYSPLTKGRRLQAPTIRELAAKVERTPAQVLIRWSLQHGLVVIPKSQRPERIRENARVFDFSLSPADMARLDGLDERSHTSWNPDTVP